MSGPFSLDVATAVRRVREHDGHAHAYISTRLDRALEDAKTPRAGSLAGVPYGLKDEFDTPDLGTTAGSWRYRDRVTPGVRSAPFRAFDDAGAVLIGKTNLSDLGLAPEASSWVGGSTRNPFDSTRTAGGSSGGSAAAVAYGMQAFGWGTDIGGSIRLPAAFCGVLGMKLSDATWPIQELFPNLPASMRWLCGQGPLTHTTEQMRAVLEAAAPVIRVDGEAMPFAPTSLELFAPSLRHWPTFSDEVTPVLKEALGLPIRVDGGLPVPGDVREVYAGIWASNLDDLLASDDGITFWRGLSAVLSGVVFRGAFGDRRFHPLTADLLLLIALGRYTVYRDRDKATSKAFAVRDAMRELWSDGRVIVMPVAVEPPPKQMRSTRHFALLDYTVYGNLGDATGLSIPFGTFDGRLPRSIQLLGPPGSEDVLLDLADRILVARDARPGLAQPRTLLP